MIKGELCECFEPWAADCSSFGGHSPPSWTGKHIKKTYCTNLTVLYLCSQSVYQGGLRAGSRDGPPPPWPPRRGHFPHHGRRGSDLKLTNVQIFLFMQLQSLTFFGLLIWVIRKRKRYPSLLLAMVLVELQIHVKKLFKSSFQAKFLKIRFTKVAVPCSFLMEQQIFFFTIL